MKKERWHDFPRKKQLAEKERAVMVNLSLELSAAVGKRKSLREGNSNHGGGKLRQRGESGFLWGGKGKLSAPFSSPAPEKEKVRATITGRSKTLLGRVAYRFLRQSRCTRVGGREG